MKYIYFYFDETFFIIIYAILLWFYFYLICFKDLVDRTHQKHYAVYFASRLTSIAESCQFLANEDSPEPLSQLEAERTNNLRKFLQIESEMEMVFEQKVPNIQMFININKFVKYLLCDFMIFFFAM